MVPEIRARRPDLNLGEIAILYPAAFIGDEVATAAANNGYGVIRTDGNALYPRGSRLMRWLEQCAMWCCGGWRSGRPRVSRVIAEGTRLFHELLATDEDRLEFQRDLIATLWDRRDDTLSLHEWLVVLRDEIINPRPSVRLWGAQSPLRIAALTSANLPTFLQTRPSRMSHVSTVLIAWRA